MPIKMVKIQNTETPDAGEDVEQKKLSFTGREGGGFL